ncbi:MAG: acetate--CoA ligase family protein [Rhodocyclaceae bacterium]|nr:acetate--CoA ligase family protein [Rhodocyclaceae bacterium]MBK6554631.1 acetate--CoA ligase family protein [Rhodocyclaceae bacterium]MBK6677434.1 acetate--CoA ligase family protein [Rhodocyclaceae bacterium]MBK9310090.1 acetate--CoA ligase family protein [Rhodocyclaceae bacterium]
MKTLSEWESKRRLADLPYPREALTGSREEAERFVSALGKPVVAKASGVAHKTEGGLVRFGVTASTVGPIWDQLAAAGDGKVLLAEQVAAELELIVGGYRDPSFGPLVTIGIGGIAAEIFGDVVALLAPPEPGEVANAVAQLSGRKLLQGIRGGPPVDIDALARVVDTVARLLVEDPSVAEVDCNPVMVCQGAPMVVDALVVLADHASA